MDNITTLITSSLIGLVAGWFSGIIAARQERLNEISEDIRESRKQAYKGLWELSGRLPRYPGSVDLGISKLGELYDLSVALANWYFNSDSGLIMSERTKKCYINTQETIEQILLDAMGENTAVISRQKIVDTPLKREKYLKTQKKFSTLRTAMTKDLLTRRKSFF